MRLTVPTILTLLRMLMIPVLVLVFYLPFKWSNFAAAALFAFASLTDWADGWIARRYNQYSNFGAFLDPVADKLMVAVALMLIVQAHPTVWMALWAAVIIGREIAVSALREWMAEVGQRGRARPCQGRGREFESRFPLLKPLTPSGVFSWALPGGRELRPATLHTAPGWWRTGSCSRCLPWP